MMDQLTTTKGLMIFWLVVGRMGGFVMGAPILGSPIIPRRVKIALILTLSFLIFSQISVSQKIFLFSHPITYLLYLLSELGLGFAIGYAIRLVFVGIELSGQLIGFQMGLDFAQSVDPEFTTQTSIISQFKYILAMMIFISVNAHYFCLKAMLDSFYLIPLGEFSLSASFVKELANMVGDVFIISLKAGAPVILTLFLVQIVMGVINRLIPQINIFMISFPLKIIVGLLVIGFSIPYFLYFVENLSLSLYHRLFLFLKIAGS